MKWSDYFSTDAMASNASTTSQPSGNGWSDYFSNDSQAKDNSIPNDVKVATSDKLPTNPNTGNTNYNGWCQSFVEQVTGSDQKFPSASDAWDKQSNKVNGLTGIKTGDAIYFAPDSSNDFSGHTGIYLGNDQFISATDNGVQQMPLSSWQKLTGQQVLGYIPVARKGD